MVPLCRNASEPPPVLHVVQEDGGRGVGKTGATLLRAYTAYRMDNPPEQAVEQVAPNHPLGEGRSVWPTVPWPTVPESAGRGRPAP